MRKEKILDLARGFWGRSKNCNVLARMRVEKGLTYAFRDRKVKKREMRTLWIQQINAGARELGVNYSRLQHGMNVSGIEVNTKIMSDLAKFEPFSFRSIVEIAKRF